MLKQEKALKTQKARVKDSKAKAISLCGQENGGPTLTLLEQDVLQMLVNSKDTVKALSSCVDQPSAYWAGIEPEYFFVMNEC